MKGVAQPTRSCKRIPDPRPEDGLGYGEWRPTRGGVRVWVELPLPPCDDCGLPLKPGDRCDTCLTWAVKNARDTEWAHISWANRHVIWDLLSIQNEHRKAA